MMSCALCYKWQHILCHNKRDQAAGHPTRNWDSVEFICQHCRAYQLDGSSAHPMLITKQRALQHSDTLRAAAASHTTPDSLQPSDFSLQGQEGPFHGSYDRQPNDVSQSSAQDPSPSSNVCDPPLASTPRQTISFNHYQPTEHGFSSSARWAYRADSHPVYGDQQLEAIAAAYKPRVLLQYSKLHVD